MTPAELQDAVRAAVAACVDNGELSVPVPSEVVVERPKVKEHGDYATNVALQLAKPAGRPPREVASLLAARLQETAGIDAVEIAGPGFLNIRLSGDAVAQVVRQVVAAGAAYGGLEGGGFETRDAAVGAFIGAGGGAVIGALVCALIPERSASVEPPAAREPPVAPLPGTIDAPREIPPA